MPNSLRERLHRAIQDADTGMPGWPLRPAYAPHADAALSTLTLSDHIAAVEVSGTHTAVPLGIYNAIAVSRKYVFAALRRARSAVGPPAIVAQRVAEIEADLAKIDAVLNADLPAARLPDAG